MSNQRFLESMEIIDTVVDMIQRSKDHSIRLNLEAGTQVASDVMFITYIRICIVLDELRKLNALCKDVPRLQDIFLCIKPFYKYVRQYEGGFYSVRNSLVAHYNRDASGRYVSFTERLGTYEVPRSIGELDFICNCLECIRIILVKNYPDAQKFISENIQGSQMRINEYGSTFKAKTPIDIQDLRRLVNKDLLGKNLVTF